MNSGDMTQERFEMECRALDFLESCKGQPLTQTMMEFAESEIKRATEKGKRP